MILRWLLFSVSDRDGHCPVLQWLCGQLSADLCGNLGTGIPPTPVTSVVCRSRSECGVQCPDLSSARLCYGPVRQLCAVLVCQLEYRP